MQNRIAEIKINDDKDKVIFTDKGDKFSPTSTKSNNKLDYIFDNEKKGESYLNSYFLQANPLRQKKV